MDKRGAVSVFIILGIVLVAIVGFIFFALSGGISMNRFTGLQVEPIKNYVESCVEEELIFNIDNLKRYAGYESLGVLNERYRSVDINYLVYNNGGTVLNRINPVVYVEEKISNNVGFYLKEQCLYDVNFGGDTYIDYSSMDINTEITPQKVYVNLKLPIQVTRGSNEVTVDGFLVDYNTKFGLLYDAVVDIVEDEVRLGDFDPVSYLVNHVDIDIEKDNIQEGKKIYTVSDKEKTEMIVFAVKR